MDHHSPPQTIIDLCVLLQITIEHHGPPWTTTIRHRPSQTSMDCCRPPQVSTDHQDHGTGHSPVERKFVSSKTWDAKCRKTKAQHETRGWGRQDGVAETLQQGESQTRLPQGAGIKHTNAHETPSPPQLLSLMCTCGEMPVSHKEHGAVAAPPCALWLPGCPSSSGHSRQVVAGVPS